jgi:hypothetical protein
VKGHSYVPGKDPVLDADLAELRKGLKKGEDPFFYDIRRTNGEQESPKPAVAGPGQDDGAVTTSSGSETTTAIRRRRLGPRVIIPAACVVLFLVAAAFAAGVWKARERRAAEPATAANPPSQVVPVATPVSPNVVLTPPTTSAPKTAPANADTAPKALRTPTVPSQRAIANGRDHVRESTPVAPARSADPLAASHEQTPQPTPSADPNRRSSISQKLEP